VKISQAIILAAGMGTRLGNIQGNKPKCLIEIQGKTLLSRTLEKLTKLHFESIHIVVGYEKEQIQKHVEILGYQNIHFVENNYFNVKGSMYSLALAFAAQNSSSWIFDADLYFDESALTNASNLDIDTTFVTKHSGSQDESVPVFDKGVFQEFKKVKQNHNPEMLGISLLRGSTIELMAEIDKLKNEKLSYESALSFVVNNNSLPLNLLYLPNYVWSDIDNEADFARMTRIIAIHEG
jgi:choline kinase